MSCDAQTQTPAPKRKACKVLQTSRCTHVLHTLVPQTVSGVGMGNDECHGRVMGVGSLLLADGLKGQKIAHQKSTPHKSSWIFSGTFQWIQVAFSDRFHVSAVCSKGLSLVQWMLTAISNEFQWHSLMDFHFREIWCKETCFKF